MKSPYPYFGGKSRIAPTVWQLLGDTPNYIEPFLGSAAVLLARPEAHERSLETVNDKDGMIANFYRALQHDPEQTAYYADNPVNENELHARHAWLVNRKDSIQGSLEGDPEWYDAKAAGWWVWGMACWIGSGFASGNGPWHVVDGKLVKISEKGGVNRQRVDIGGRGRGVNRQSIDEGEGIYAYFNALAERLQSGQKALRGAEQ